MQNPINHPIGFQARVKQDRIKFNQAMEVVSFARDLNQAGVQAKARVKSIIGQYDVDVRSARLAVKITQPKKHRRRS